MKFICICCNYQSDYNTNYNKHLRTVKHKNKLDTNSQPKVNPESTQSQPLGSPKSTQKYPISIHKVSTINDSKQERFICKYCDQKFTFKQSMYKHIKYSCTKNNDEDLKELVRLLNNQLEQQKYEFEEKLQTQSKQIEKLMNKLEINNSFNNNNNTINNITLLNYRDTDVSHLTDNDYKKCIKKVCFCVMGLIEKIHFNPEKPENMNIYISNMKDKYLMVYENGNWNLKNKSELDRLYDDKETMIEQWIEENKDTEMEKFFNRYLDLKKDDKTIEMINEEIKLMMYNKKKMIE